MEQIDYKFIDQVLADHACDASQIIAIMQDVQGKYRYLPKDALRYIANKVGISESKIYGVATFYSQFTLKPRGKYTMGICLGTACYVRGSQQVLDELEKRLGIGVGETTADGMFTLNATRCIGCCGLAPAMMVNDEVYGRLVPGDVPGIIEKYRARG